MAKNPTRRSFRRNADWVPAEDFVGKGSIKIFLFFFFNQCLLAYKEKNMPLK